MPFDRSPDLLKAVVGSNAPLFSVWPPLSSSSLVVVHPPVRKTVSEMALG